MCESIASMQIWREDKFWQSFATQKKLNFYSFLSLSVSNRILKQSISQISTEE